MKFGIMYANAGPFGLPDHLENLVRSAEDTGQHGFSSIAAPVRRLPDHTACTNRLNTCRLLHHRTWRFPMP